MRVLILTTFDLDEYVFTALRAGASGFLLKSISPAELLNAIQVIAAGDALLAPSVTRRLVEEFARTPPLTPAVPAGGGALDVITAREREVLALVAGGLSNTEIANRLDITPATTKTHVGHLLDQARRAGSRAPGHTGLPGGPRHPRVGDHDQQAHSSPGARACPAGRAPRSQPASPACAGRPWPGCC